MKIVKDIKEVDINQVKQLYDEAFNDEIEYREELINNYLKNSKFYGVVDKDQLVMITFFTPKRIYYKNQKHEAFLIFAVAVKKEYQNKKIMSKYLSKFIDEMKLFTDFIFIQSHNWDIYKHFDFVECTKFSKWILRKDQFLKFDNINEKTNYENINKINIQFLRDNNIDNFVYKTEKENKKYLKLYLKCGYQIIMSNRSYLIYDPKIKEIEKYAFFDQRDFIKLISSLPYETTINSYINLDKRFFVLKEESQIKTKICKTKSFDKNEPIYFLDNW
ncbi:GNAT family N-acetyltransferase [Malacoplasma penetrans]|nr:GNAT family N-acetyltransferase [Malacoplasma penetrans]RXY96322.1 GNAT family N-acetyltransferase [Malacoplasma penetrans]